MRRRPKGFFRAYEIERDEDGMPIRLFWAGDTVPGPELIACPKCGSTRWQDRRCLDCWHHGGEPPRIRYHPNVEVFRRRDQAVRGERERK